MRIERLTVRLPASRRHEAERIAREIAQALGEAGPAAQRGHNRVKVALVTAARHLPARELARRASGAVSAALGRHRGDGGGR